MVEPKRTNWADESDSEWSEEEAETRVTAPEESAPQPATPSTPQPSHLETRLAQLSPPYRLRLSNLPFNCNSDKDIKRFLGLLIQEEDKINLQLIMAGNSFRGIATLETSDLDVAIKVARRNAALLKERPVSISIEGEYSGSGQRRGGNRRQGGPRDDRPRKPRDDRGPREDRDRPREDRTRGTNRRGNFRGQPGTRQPYKKLENANPEYIRKGSDAGFSRPQTQTSQPEPVAPLTPSAKADPRPKANPFGAARPVDTQSKDIEFEKKKVETPELATESPQAVQSPKSSHPPQPVPEAVESQEYQPERKYSEKRYKKVTQPDSTAPREEPAPVPTPPPMERKVIKNAWRNPEEAKSVIASNPQSTPTPEPVPAKGSFQASETSSSQNSRGQAQGKRLRRVVRGRRGRG